MSGEGGKSQTHGQTSLFAGMNLGKSGKSAQPKNEKTIQNVQESLSKLPDIPSFKRQGGSSFSFIRQTNTSTAGQQTASADHVLERSKPESNGVSVDKTATLLELFEPQNESPSTLGDETTLLSYSDQLAEILPMATPADNPLSTTLESTVMICDDDDDDDNDDDNIDNEDEVVDNDDDNNNDDDDDDDDGIADNGNTHKPLLDLDDRYVTQEQTFPAEALIKAVPTKNYPDTNYNVVLEPEDELSLFFTQHSFKLSELRKEKEELQRDLHHVYEDVKNKMISLEEKIKSLKQKFEESLSNDDYDLAAETNERIEELTSEKYELECTRPKLLNNKVKKYLNKISNFEEKEMEFHQWALLKYDEFLKEQNEVLSEHRKSCSRETEAKRDDLELQKDEINRNLEHLQLDKEHLKKDRSDLDSKIDAKLEVFQNRKEGLLEKQKCLQDEIEKLENRLKELKSESKEVELDIQKENDKMVDARKEFESLETKLSDKSERIEMEEETFKAQLEHIQLEEKDLEEMAVQKKEKEERLQKNINCLVSGKTEAEDFIGASQDEAMKTLLEIFLTNLSEEEIYDLKKLRTLEKAKAADLQELELQVFNKEQKMAVKKKRIEEIGNQVPEYEKAKKIAVSDHNFKEAKRLNEVIKRLSSEIATSKMEVQEVEETLEDERMKVPAMRKEYEELRKNVLTAKESHDLANLVNVMKRIVMLVKQESRTHKDSLLESLRQAELDFLKIEFSFLESPAENITHKMNDSDKENLVFVKKLLKLEKKMDSSSEEDETRDKSEDSA